MRHFIIDAHNVLFSSAELRSLLSGNPIHAYRKLLQTCDSLAHHTNIVFTAVFDGFEPEGFSYLHKKISIRFSKQKTADAVIKTLIARIRNPKNAIVVSADSEIRNFARAHACTLMSPHEFLSKTNRSKHDSTHTEKPERDDLSIDEWLDLFDKK